MSKKIDYYQIRDFGAKFGVTIDFYRSHIKSLAIIGLIIGIPSGIFTAYYMSSTMESVLGFGSGSDAESIGAVSQMISNYSLMSIFSLVVGSLFISMVYVYMQRVENGEEPPSIGELFGKTISRVPGMMVLYFAIMIIVGIGFVLLVLPGIYLAVVLSIAVPIYLFENASVGQSISGAFRLIKGKWWNTFGLLFVTSLIAAMAGYIFAVPMYIGMFAELFSLGSSDPEDVAGVFQNWTTVVGTAIYTTGSYILYIIPMIALAFQYFNLKERVDGVGLKSEVDSFENLK